MSIIKKTKERRIYVGKEKMINPVSAVRNPKIIIRGSKGTIKRLVKTE